MNLSLSRKEYQVLARAAKRDGLSVSPWVREAALRVAADSTLEKPDR